MNYCRFYHRFLQLNLCTMKSSRGLDRHREKWTKNHQCLLIFLKVIAHSSPNLPRPRVHFFYLPKSVFSLCNSSAMSFSSFLISALSIGSRLTMCSVCSCEGYVCFLTRFSFSIHSMIRILLRFPKSLFI